jgi:hypothetical protein
LLDFIGNSSLKTLENEYIETSRGGRLATKVLIADPDGSIFPIQITDHS